ncbi:MAG: bifunctional diaminohydroxyphosphoribosylaminopyrimidine [Acidobacteriota bacterium]
MTPPLTSEQALAWSFATRGPWPSPDGSATDQDWMALALQEATDGVGLSSPNPPVGCVITRDRRLLGRGVHLQAGQPHAEVLAIQRALDAGEDLRGATAYITLEPCCHSGRTPPCTDALIQAGIRRVVLGAVDLNPRVNGGGVAILRSAGIEVTTGVLENECIQFHKPFFKWVQTGRPWLTVKLALGENRRVGVAEQVTDPATQSLSHALRRASDGIMVGSETIRTDNPQLTDRWPSLTLSHRRFHRIVLVGQKNITDESVVWTPQPGEPLLRVSTRRLPAREHITDIVVPPDGKGRPSLLHTLAELGAWPITRLLLEGGPTLIQCALDQNLVDEIHLFSSSRQVRGPIFQPLENAWKEHRSFTFGPDLWKIYRLKA